jgi:acetyltransferase-like isoleucine patch superfamily enzyme
VSPKAIVKHSDLHLTRDVFIGDRVTIYQTRTGGAVTLAKGVRLYADITIETGEGGEISIGEDTHIQPGCRLSAYMGSIRIGRRVEMAPNCAFFPYNHGIVRHIPIRDQRLVTKGDIVIEDDAWLGVGVIVLDGVRIGKGAVVGAGSVVTGDIAENGVAVGNPARLVKMRE